MSTRWLPLLLLALATASGLYLLGMQYGWLVAPFGAVLIALGCALQHHYRRNRALCAEIERHKSQLDDAERRLQLMMDTLPASISFIDGDERYCQTNAMADEWYGRERGAAHGQSMCDCLSAGAYATSKPYIDAALAGEASRFSIESPYPNGDERWVDVRYVPHRSSNGEVLGFYSMVTDLSESRHAQEKLRMIIDSLPAGIAYVDRDECFVEQNATGARWTGRAPGEAVGQHLADIWRPATYNHCVPYVRRALRGEEVEFDIQIDSGDQIQHGRFLHVHYMPHRDHSGEVQGYLSLMTDITEDRRREAHLHLIMDSVPGAIGYFDAAQVQCSANATWLSWFGRGGDPVGRTLREVAGSVLYANLRLEVSSVLSGEPCEFEQTLPWYGEGKQQRSVHGRFVPHLGEEGGVQGFFALLVDISEMRQAEAAMRESEERLRLVSESVSEFLWETSPEGRFTYISERCEEVRGYRPEELVGQSPYDFIVDEDVQRMRDLIATAIAERRPFNSERRIRCKSGEVIWERITGVPRYDQNGLYLGSYGACENINARKLVEEQTRLMMDSVPAAIAYIDLQQYYRQRNATWQRWFEERECYLDRHIFEDLGAENYARLQTHIEAALRGEARDFEAPNVIGGEPRTMHVHYVPHRVEVDGQHGQVAGFYVLITDITEVHEANRQLAHQRSMLERAEAMAHVGSWHWPVDEAYFTLSDESCRILGRPIGDRHPIAEVLALYHPEDRARVQSTIREVVLSGVSQVLEMRMTLACGELREVLVNMAAERDGERTLALSGMIQDITERKHAERLEARLRDIAAQVPGAIFQAQRSAGGIESLSYLSQGAEQVFGHSLDALQVHPKTLLKRVSREQRASLLAAIDQSARDQSDIEQVVRYQRGDGQPCWLEIRAAARLSADGGTEWSGHVQDVTQRQTVEAQLSLAKQRLQDAIESLPGGFMLYDADDRLVFWNHAQEELFTPPDFRYYEGMPFEELVRFGVERIEGYGDFDDPEEREAFIRERVAQHRKPASDHEMLLGNQRWAWIRERRTSEGGVVGIRIDISELKRAQDELRQHRDNLQQRVEERTAELQRAVQDAQRANAMKSEFLANMSHELRTPMHAILSFAGMGRGRAERAERDKLEHYFGRINDSGQRLMALLNDLLDLSKLEAGRMELNFAQEDWRAIVHTALEEFAALMETRGIRISCQSDEPNASLCCDASRILQVVRNLLSNAIKFSPDDSCIGVGLHRQPSVNGEASGLLLRITDQGPGIPEDELEAVFDKFVQSSKTHTGAGGTGLGLAICREIVALHGGSIHADNAAEGGAIFSVCLPRERSGNSEA